MGRIKRTKDLFVKESKLIYNDFFDYSLVLNDYYHSYDKVQLKCNKCNSLVIHNISKHLNKRKPIFCKCVKHYALAKSFIEKSKLTHNNFYDYSKIYYLNNTTAKVDILCPIHGLFSQSAAAHAHGQKCPKCARELQSKWSIKTFDDMIKRIQHFDRYDYSKFEFVNSTTKGLIRCKVCDYEFYQSLSSQTQGHGCPNCANKMKITMKSSKMENDLFNMLKTDFVNLEQSNRTILNGEELDIVNCETKRAIEFNGDYWHCNPETYKCEYMHPVFKRTAEWIWEKDKNKIEKAKALGYDILVVWESEWKKDKIICFNKCKDFLNNYKQEIKCQ